MATTTASPIHEFTDHDVVPGICGTCQMPRGNRAHRTDVSPTQAPEATYRPNAGGPGPTPSAPGLDLARAARDLMQSTSLKGRVFRAVAVSMSDKQAGPGLTDEQIKATRLLREENHNSVRPRRVDLSTAGILVAATDEHGREVKRKVGSGEHATVFVLSPELVAAAKRAGVDL